MAHQWGLDQLDWDTFTSPQFKDDDFPPLSSSTGQSVMNRSSSSLNAADLATHIDRNAGATTPPLIDLESFDDNTSYVPAPVAISHDLEDLLLFSPVTERRSQVEVKAEEVSQHLSSRPSSSQASVPLNYGKPLDAEASFINIASLQQRKRKTKKEQQEEAERSMKHYFPIKESSHPVAADAFTEIPVPPLITPQRDNQPIAEPDNAGMAAYRARQKPAVRYPLPRNVNPYSTIKTNVAELRQESVYTNLAEIATATGTHIEKAMNVNREKGKNETGVYLDIRGTAEQAKIAIQEIEKWITAAYPGRSKPEWSKTAAVTDATKLKIRKQIRLEARRESFRQAPPESLESVSTARFPWPEDKVSFRPEQVLGSNLEALDPIRMDCQCYITLEKGSKFLQVLGENEEQVHSALQRLKVTCDQVLARNFEPAKIVFLMPLKDMACEIQLLPYGGPKVAGRYLNPEPIGRFPVIRRRDTESKRGKASRGSKSNSEASVLSSSSGSAPSLEDPQQDRIIIIGRLEEEVAWALQELRHFRGNLQLRVKLGTPVLTKYPKPKNKNDQYIYSVSEFAEIIENPEVESFVTQEIGHPGVGRHVLQRLVQNGHHLLCPEDPMASELKDVKPVFSGVFMIRSPDGSGDLRLQVDFKEEAGSYGTTPMRWCKAERGKKEPTLLLDASTVDLERGTAWHFGLTTTQGVEKTQLPKHYADFAFADWSVKLDAELAQKFGENHQYITFGRKGVPSTVPIQTVEQKTAWRFCIKGSAYICEVAKVSTVILGVRTQLNPPETQICEPRWSVSVWHSDWDVELQAHSKLKIGEEVPWTDAMPKFFPSNGYGEGDSEDGTGFQKLMGKLKRLEELVVGKVE
ncbi:hypothetical protein H2199_001680 [Coniosporium tulheliwenetii]|uniref:Uncharacterized protein n=1 Tax=Coniosporium tulheliwenetii TaxID=3383036 RepID=A0ACC2ZKB6_9PEZI|nr:hypothetical protein H2199_001680 [Cladosporium sp. JES 115]